MHHDAAACVGLLAVDEETAAMFVDHGAIEALLNLLPDAREDEIKRDQMRKSGVTPQEVKIEPHRRMLPMWRSSEIRTQEERYDMRVQVIVTSRQKSFEVIEVIRIDTTCGCRCHAAH